jgi:hypothetical protein
MHFEHQLSHAPTIRHGQCEENPNGGMLDHRAKRIIVINTFTLFEALGDQTGLVAINRAIGVVFQFVPICCQLHSDQSEAEQGARCHSDAELPSLHPLHLSREQTEQLQHN